MKQAASISNDAGACRISSECLKAEWEKMNNMMASFSLADEQMRKSVAAELQDNIGQMLLSARIRAGMISSSTDPSEQEALLKEIRFILDQAVSDIRSLYLRLSPPLFVEASYETSIQWLCKDMESKYGLRVELMFDVCKLSLTDQLRSALYYAAEELLLNVARHAHTGEALLSLGCEFNVLWLRVQDQGIGFNLADAFSHEKQKSSSGLIKLRQRIEYLGGKANMLTSPGKGTSVTILIPLEKTKGARIHPVRGGE
jgi:signal transduction histidine kinase